MTDADRDRHRKAIEAIPEIAAMLAEDSFNSTVTRLLIDGYVDAFDRRLNAELGDLDNWKPIGILGALADPAVQADLQADLDARPPALLELLPDDTLSLATIPDCLAGPRRRDRNPAWLVELDQQAGSFVTPDERQQIANQLGAEDGR